MNTGRVLSLNYLVNKMETSSFYYYAKGKMVFFGNGFRDGLIMRLFVLGFLFLILSVTTGCTTAAVAVIDEKMSQLTGEECTTVNIMFGEDYCRARQREIKQDPVYCYRSLGGVNCYSQKEPYAAPSDRVRQVSELGSQGAKVEYISEKRGTGPIFKWSFSTEKLNTAELE